MIRPKLSGGSERIGEQGVEVGGLRREVVLHREVEAREQQRDRHIHPAAVEAGALAGLDVGHACLDALLEALVGERDQPRVGQHHLTPAGDVLAGLRARGEDAEQDLGKVVDEVAVGSPGTEGLEQPALRTGGPPSTASSLPGK